MMPNKLKILGEKIIRQYHFQNARKFYQAFTQSNDQIRNIIFSGLYKSQPAILKIYREFRLTDEPAALTAFNQTNQSRVLRAPELYQAEIISPSFGWLIEQKLDRGKFLKSPLTPAGRREFLNVYIEYRRNFPKWPHRDLHFDEKLPANLFHLHRISRWLQMVINKEADGQTRQFFKLFLAEDFLGRFRAGLKIIAQEFKSRKMLWCHGHFKPKEIFKGKDGQYYLTDFAHVKMYPEGYELAFMIWADWLMPGNWRLPYQLWRQPIFAWLKDLKPIARTLKLKRFKALMRASLIERIFGAILADVAASAKPLKEKRLRLKLLYKLFDELVGI